MVSGKTMVLWTIEHRVFSYDNCAKIVSPLQQLSVNSLIAATFTAIKLIQPETPFYFG